MSVHLYNFDLSNVKKLKDTCFAEDEFCFECQ